VKIAENRLKNCQWADEIKGNNSETGFKTKIF
jgi:hypothetical protein